MLAPRKYLIVVLAAVVLPLRHGNAATVVIDASRQLGMLKRFERYNSIQSWISGDTEKKLLQDLGTTHIRGIKSENSIAGVGCTPIFNKWGYPSSLSTYKEELIAELRHYKERFPRMEYIEIMNEPDGTWYHGGYKTPAQYMTVFKAAIEAVETVNKEIPANLPRLQIGGPVTYKWNPTYLYDCLDIVKRENLRFDFVVWHEYHVATTPSAIRTRTKEMRTKLAALGLNNVKIIITEWGISPGGDNLSPSSAELLKSAAFVASGNYYWIDGGADIVCQWVVRHEKNRIKSQFAGAPGSGKVYPFYNVLKMMSLMKKVRVQETIDGMTSAGIGVGGYGAMDSSGLSAIVWNYQGTTQSATVKFTGLPSAFRNASFRVQRFLIDDTHSNYAYNTSRDMLEKIDEKTESGATEYSTSLTMKQNSIALVLLTPAGQGGSPTAVRPMLPTENPAVSLTGTTLTVRNVAAPRAVATIIDSRGRHLSSQTLGAACRVMLGQELTPGVYVVKLRGDGLNLEMPCLVR